jgi:uroporphyrinogen-III synthase
VNTRRPPLSGVGVLVTRPAEQAAELADRLRELGAEPLRFPALAILPPRDPESLRARLVEAARFDLALFVSPAAVRWGLAALPPTRGLRDLAASLAAVGQGSAEALRAAGHASVLAPASGFDSEHLLALPELSDVAGKRILIFRGAGGRELIAATLRARGATVDHAECYRRGCPRDADPAPVLDALHGGRLQAVTAFSGETLDHLLTLLAADAGALRALPLFVPHARIAAHARARDFVAVIATPPGETGLLAGLVEYFAHD